MTCPKLHAAPDGSLTPGKINAIGAVRAKCDVVDGLKDGIIGRPDVSKFDQRNSRAPPVRPTAA